MDGTYRSISGGISRGREKEEEREEEREEEEKKRENLEKEEKGAALPIRCPQAKKRSVACEEKKHLPAWGEGTRRQKSPASGQRTVMACGQRRRASEDGARYFFLSSSSSSLFLPADGRLGAWYRHTIPYRAELGMPVWTGTANLAIDL
ncbi:hypothetical protein GW17_00023929 [Ensete ventricosum]|nr:hypothetical protein GW17_00023929 [Ensete ventricosum]